MFWSGSWLVKRSLATPRYRGTPASQSRKLERKPWMVAFAIFTRRGTIPWPYLRPAFSVSDRRNEFPAREILQPFENQYGAITLWHSVAANGGKTFFSKSI